MPTSVRLDERTEQLLQRLANRGSCSKSEIIRIAIEALAREESSNGSEMDSLFDLVSDLLGKVKDGPPDLSERTGQGFRELLVSRRTSAGR